MNKKLFCLLLILVLPISLLFTGCSNKSAQTSNVGKEYIIGDIILVKIAKETEFCVLVDKNTRVMYLYNTTSYQGGLTPLLDSDGKPLLYEGEL